MRNALKYSLMALSALLFTGCVLVDQDMSDCETDYTLDYELRLVTNMTTELQTQLSMAADVNVSSALRQYMSGIFTDYAHDVNLSFYDVYGDSTRLHNERHIMDANQSSYTLFIPVRKYMHIAIANIEDNHEVGLEKDEICHTSRLFQPIRDTVESHSTGVFTARLPMDIKEGEDQQFDVKLYMANCATALVLDTLGSHIKDIDVYATGFATGFSLADSTYRYEYTPVVKAKRLAVDGADSPLCFTTVTFPSKDVPSSKVTIESPEDFITDASETSLWQYRVYCHLDDGTVTETILGVKLPLQAGQLKVVKAAIQNDGACVPMAPWVGSLVTLDWIDQPGWEVDF